MTCSSSVLILATLLTALAGSAGAQDDSSDNGTDPTRLSRNTKLSYDDASLVSGTGVQSLKGSFGQKISADGRTGINISFPAIATSISDDGFGAGDLSIQLTQVLAQTKSYGIVVKGEYLFDTAESSDRGAGGDLIELTAIYAMFLPDRAIFAPSLEHAFSVGSRDPGRGHVNVTTLDLYYVPRLADKRNYMTLDPALIYDWESDEMSGALAVTLGRQFDLGLPGNESFYIKPRFGIGAHRALDYAVEVGFKVVGF